MDGRSASENVFAEFTGIGRVVQNRSYGDSEI